jgi:hypothetical protein
MSSYQVFSPVLLFFYGSSGDTYEMIACPIVFSCDQAVRAVAHASLNMINQFMNFQDENPVLYESLLECKDVEKLHEVLGDISIHVSNYFKFDFEINPQQLTI